MRRIEIILVTATIIASITTWVSRYTGGFLCTLTFLILALFYLLFGFLLFNNIPIRQIFKRAAYANVHWGRIIFSVLSGFILSLGTISLLFGVLRWEGRAIILLETGIFLLILGAIGQIMNLVRPGMFYRGIMLRAGIGAMLTLLFFFLSRS